jgi:chlorobactene glucosyltransferase
MIIWWIALFITYILLIFTLTMIMNVFIFPRMGTRTPQYTPHVSIMIPARNEADVIGRTIDKLRQQTYTQFELLVMDDKSTDGTGDIAREARDNDARIQIFNGTPVPDAWMGKSWACHNLVQHARGDILLFTDADVRWEATALADIVAQMEQSKVDMLTVWSTQETVTPAERLIVPLIALAILGYLPVVMVHHSPFALFSAANGQCMAWRREAYEKIGGHTSVANNVLDDVTMAKLAKQAGYRIRMVDGARQISTRMYDNWRAVRDGFAKNILAGYGNSVIALFGASVLHWLLFLFPFVMLALPDYRLWGALLIIQGLALRALSAAFTDQRLSDVLLMPVSVLLMTRIAAQSIYWHYTGGPRWKGRKLGKQGTQTKDSSWQTQQASSSAQASAD